MEVAEAVEEAHVRVERPRASKEKMILMRRRGLLYAKAHASNPKTNNRKLPPTPT